MAYIMGSQVRALACGHLALYCFAAPAHPGIRVPCSGTFPRPFAPKQFPLHNQHKPRHVLVQTYTVTCTVQTQTSSALDPLRNLYACRTACTHNGAKPYNGKAVFEYHMKTTTSIGHSKASKMNITLALNWYSIQRLLLLPL